MVNNRAAAFAVNGILIVEPEPALFADTLLFFTEQCFFYEIPDVPGDENYSEDYNKQCR